MKVRHDFPHEVRLVEHTWIPLSDGCRLAARIWLPADADRAPVPAILEYIPYRKSDGTADRDAVTHPYFAGHGYASVRVDLRGSGDSDGILEDEYLPREQEDALEVIAWIAAQPWCTGAVGMMGISWGGFNSLQVAARRPPELRAIITVCASDDRYTDDVHYLGGCVLANDMLAWATTMLAFEALPPNSDAVGEGWHEAWLERLERTTPFIGRWLAHQRRDEYWRQGSVCEDYAAIECPVYAVGGWADGYTSAVFRLLEGLPGPRKGLVGPWSHAYPHEGVPGPAIGFLQEAIRWWDHWLKGIDAGVMDEPMLRYWLQDSAPARPRFEIRPGRWRSERTWPSSDLETHAFFLGAEGVVTETPANVELTCVAAQQTGLAAGAWCAEDQPADLPVDQRADDALSLTFTSAPIESALDIVGFPTVRLALAADRPSAFVVARLCDVAPSGESALVTRGVLNLTHREGHADPSPLEPGERYDVVVPMKAIAWSLPAGHRLRVALSPAYWPLAWPSPEQVTLTVFSGPGCKLVLPVTPPGRADEMPFEEAEGAEPLPVEVLAPGPAGRVSRHVVADDRFDLSFRWDVGGHRRLESLGLEIDERHEDTFSIVSDRPLSARATSSWSIGMRSARVNVDIEASGRMRADPEAFHVTTSLAVSERDERVFERTWELSFPRDHV